MTAADYRALPKKGKGRHALTAGTQPQTSAAMSPARDLARRPGLPTVHLHNHPGDPEPLREAIRTAAAALLPPGHRLVIVGHLHTNNDDARS